MSEKLLRPDQVAARLQVTREMVYKLINQGRLDALRVGKVWRITERSLDRYVAEQLVRASGADAA